MSDSDKALAALREARELAERSRTRVRAGAARRRFETIVLELQEALRKAKGGGHG